MSKNSKEINIRNFTRTGQDELLKFVDDGGTITLIRNEVPALGVSGAKFTIEVCDNFEPSEVVHKVVRVKPRISAYLSSLTKEGDHFLMSRCRMGESRDSVTTYKVTCIEAGECPERPINRADTLWHWWTVCLSSGKRDFEVSIRQKNGSLKMLKSKLERLAGIAGMRNPSVKSCIHKGKMTTDEARAKLVNISI